MTRACLGWLIRNTLTYVQAAIDVDSDNVHDIPGFRDVIIVLPSTEIPAIRIRAALTCMHMVRPGEEAKKKVKKRKEKKGKEEKKVMQRRPVTAEKRQ